jgi:hypothetical protein
MLIRSVLFRREAALPSWRSMSVYGRSIVPHAQGVTTADPGRERTENESMSQITKTAQAKPITNVESYGRAITVGLAVTAAVIVVAFLLTRPMAPIPTRGAGADQLTDGFLPGAIAAHAAQQLRNAQALSDGWEASLVGPVRAAQNDVRDGWDVGLVGGIATTPHEVRDGWEAGLMPPAPSGNDITDGWESSLFK